MGGIFFDQTNCFIILFSKSYDDFFGAKINEKAAA